MTISSELRQRVRQRANYACEFCGVTEADSGGELTIDHFRPTAFGGGDEFDNLIYSCYRCNLNKADYWPVESQVALWNPRSESTERHWLMLPDGTLHPLTAVGSFSIQRLRLNRPPLVAHRARKTAQATESALVARHRELIALLERLHQQQLEVLEEQRQLLEEYRTLLRLGLSESD